MSIDNYNLKAARARARGGFFNEKEFQIMNLELGIFKSSNF